MYHPLPEDKKVVNSISLMTVIVGNRKLCQIRISAGEDLLATADPVCEEQDTLAVCAAIATGIILGRPEQWVLSVEADSLRGVIILNPKPWLLARGGKTDGPDKVIIDPTQSEIGSILLQIKHYAESSLVSKLEAVKA